MDWLLIVAPLGATALFVLGLCLGLMIRRSEYESKLISIIGGHEAEKRQLRQEMREFEKSVAERFGKYSGAAKA